MELKESNIALNAETILQALVDGKEIHLSRCRIEGAFDLNRLLQESGSLNTEKLQESGEKTARTLVFSQALNFNACTFKDDVVFAGPWESPETLKVIFEKEVLFNSSVFEGQTRFSGAEFRGLAAFDGCTFGRVCSFAQASFGDRAMFRTTTFEGYGLFNEARFQADTRFANTCFGKGVNYSGVTFENRCDFSGVYSRHKSVPIYENVSFVRRYFGDDASFWRFVKQVCQEAGYYQEAGECFYRERCAHFWHRYRGPHYERLSSAQKISRWFVWIRLWPEFVLGRLLFGYGERPIRVLGAGAMIVFLCGLFYCSNMASFILRPELESSSPDGHLTFVEGLYYSTVTFTTLGFGDISPSADVVTRMVTMLEAMAGACLMALFVVTLSKRFSRG